MTPKQSALLDNHRDLAATFTNDRTPVFWVLDLTDPVGLEIAKVVAPPHENLEFRAETVLKNNGIPAYTLAATLDSSNDLLEARWGKPRMPFPSKNGRPPIMAAYVCIVSDNRLCVIAIPCFSTPSNTRP